MTIELHRSIIPILKNLSRDGFQLVGLEQTTYAQCLYTFPFQRRTALVIGNERTGLTDEILRLLHATVEIPVYGIPHSFNVATAAGMALYEYCRQFPSG